MESNSVSSKDHGHYEPSPISKTQDDGQPPPIPPPRGWSFFHRIQSQDSRNEHGSTAQKFPLSLYHTMRQSISVDLKSLCPNGPVKLSQFITRYSALLPCQVKLIGGTANSCLPTPLPKDDIINLHFIKHTKVGVMMDSSSGEDISVPLNSAAKFSILYDPNSNFEEALNGHHFGSVREVMAIKPLPLVVQATQGYQGNTVSSSVKEGEILRVRGIKTFFRTKQLRLQNLRKESKHLSEKCSASFTTAPKHLLLPLSSILELGIDLPVRVVIGSGDEVSTGSVLVLEKMAGETCLIASYPEWQQRELHHIEISSDVDMEVEAITMNETSRQELISVTDTLFCSFSSSIAVQTEHELKTETDKLRKEVHSKLLPGCEQQGVQLVRPPTLVHVAGASPFEDQCFPQLSTIPEAACTILPSGGVVEVEDDDSESIYVQMGKLNTTLECQSDKKPTEQTSSQDPESNIQQSSNKDTTGSIHSKESKSSAASTPEKCTMTSNMTNVVCKVDELLSAYQEQQSCVLQELQKLQSTVVSLQKDMQSLKCALKTYAKNQYEPIFDEGNRRILANLDCKQVLIGSLKVKYVYTCKCGLFPFQVVAVLKALDLPEYEEVFLREQVDGHVLLQLNEQILTSELGVDSKLHCIRIMNLVAGKIPREKMTLLKEWVSTY